MCGPGDVSAKNEVKVGRSCLVFARRPLKCSGSDAVFLKKTEEFRFYRSSEMYSVKRTFCIYEKTRRSTLKFILLKF